MSQATANIVRRLRDVNNVKTIALPVNAATVRTASIDLGSAVLGPLADEIQIKVTIPATPSLADTKTLTPVLEDSADDSSRTAIPGMGLAVITGSGGAGGGAATYTLKPGPKVRRYLTLSIAGVSSGGDNSAVSATLEVMVNS